MKEKIISLTKENIEDEHICCAIGNDKENQARAMRKREWLKKRFEEGMIFKKFDLRGKVFVQSSPSQFAWAPVIAEDYGFIQCLWVAGKFAGQGYASALMEECEKDYAHTNGLVLISSKKKMPFLADKKFLLKKGFEVCDSVNEYELMVKKFKPDAPDPKFSDSARSLEIDDTDGVVVYWSDACPFCFPYLPVMEEAAKKFGFNFKSVEIESVQQACHLPMPFGICGTFVNGQFLTQEIMTEKSFEKKLKKAGLID